MSECSQDRSSLLPPHASALSRYAVVRSLGHGGMAETFVARSIDPARHELVCLKRLKPALAADPAQRASFSDEARVLSRLCHPNVLSVLDAGTDLEGPFLVTELLEGLDLRRFLRWLAELGEPMPEPLALRIARDVADALAHAHEHGVLHRDVTPANVLLGRDGRVVLIDFGIARSEVQTQRTRTGLVKGKVAYMAPEQALGAGLDARTDLFALGVVLFEMLAGTRPHDGASDVETVTNAVRGRHRPLGRPLATHGLDALIEALLHPQPSRRPADASFVVRSLEGSRVADAAELAAWVRTACETEHGQAPSAARDEGTRKSARARPETATTPELAIDTILAPATESCAIAGESNDEPTRIEGDDEATRIEAALYEAALEAAHEDARVRDEARTNDDGVQRSVRDWRPSDPPTILEPAQALDASEPAPEQETVLEHGHAIEPAEATELTPRFELEDAAMRTDATVAAPTAVERHDASRAPTTSGLTPRPRRMVVLLRTVAMLAGGVVAGMVTGGAVAMLLRCAL
ncbi:MAG: serine/threonine protein kinase [Sandaracinaceae bacterium]|nr:serine/threonine protein kinase [Sandaracinaceae bacterium]